MLISRRYLVNTFMAQAVVPSSRAQAARSCARTKTEELCGFHDDWIVDFKRTD
jgi:hypothetical protein